MFDFFDRIYIYISSLFERNEQEMASLLTETLKVTIIGDVRKAEKC